MQYQFLRAVTVQGRPYAAGAIIDESDIPRGSEECLLRRFVSPVAKTPDEPPRQSKKKER